MPIKTFALTDKHLKLLRNMWTNWNPNYSEWGAPCIDSKRPYGNSDVISDMHDILTGKYIDENELDSKGIDYDEFIDNLHDKYEKLHRETETALQIALSTGKFETGKYELRNYGKDWVKVD